MLKKLLLTGLLFASGMVCAAGRIEVMRFGNEVQSAVLEKGDSETFNYSDGMIITLHITDEDENGVVAEVTASVDAADFYTHNDVVEWGKSLTIAEPKSDEIISITFAQVEKND